MKKWGSLLLAVLLVLGLAGSGWAEDAETAPAYDELTVGNPTPVEGNFFTEMWGNNTADLDVRELLYGYNLVTWDDENGMFTVNPTVVADGGLVVMDDEEGDRTYLLTLYSDLKYSDGTPITARDYAFTFLMQISPVISELGGTPLRVDYLMGYQEYMTGEPVLSGVRVLSDTQLMITVRHEFLPFFYELGLLDCFPYPIHVIAPGCSVKDDGNGAYIDGPFTPELLRSTVLDPDTGYRSHPSVVSGPYVLTSYDGTVCEFERNPWYKGNAEGITPMIHRLRLVPVSYDTMMDQLQTGEIGLLNKVLRADAIAAGAALSGGGVFTNASYPRLGLSFVSFNCERPAVNSAAVRQAIACCMDKEQLIADYAGAYGLRVDGYYGLGQWMYQMLSGTMMYPVQEPEENTAEARAAYEETLEAWEELSMDSVPVYELDPARAAQLLEAEGWKTGADGIREKDGVRLQLTMLYPEGNNIYTSMEKHFLPYLAEAGIEVTLVPTALDELLDQFYHRTERTADMLYLGSNFDLLFDPAAHFQSGPNGTPAWNYTDAEDEELYRIALSMRQTAPGDLLSYCQRWLAFQQRFAEVEPMIPLYSNVYFDFFTTTLHGYYPSGTTGWSEAIQDAYLGDAEEPEELEETEDAEDADAGEEIE